MSSAFDYSTHYLHRHPPDPDSVEAEVEFRRAGLVSLVERMPTRTAVDLGCGTGLSVEALRRLGVDAVGVERDAGLVEVCRQRGLPVIETDDLIGALDGKERALGLVLLFDVLEHVPVSGQLELCRRIARALAPGGLLYVKVPNASSPVTTLTRISPALLTDFPHL